MTNREFFLIVTAACVLAAIGVYAKEVGWTIIHRSVVAILLTLIVWACYRMWRVVNHDG